MAIRNWIGSVKSLHYGRRWDYFRAVSTLLPNAAFASPEAVAESTERIPSPGALTHANSAKVKFLGVFVGFVDDSKRKRQYEKALEKRRRVIHRLRQLQKQRQESWEKQVERLALNAFTRAYRKALNTLRSGSKAKQAIFDKATELGTKAALTLTDHHPLMTTDDLKKLLEQEEDHFARLGWEHLPVSVKIAYENLMLSIDNACEDLKLLQIAGSSSSRSRPPALPTLNQTHTSSDPPESDTISDPDLHPPYENVMDRLADPENLSAAYSRIKSKLQFLSDKSDEDWHDLSPSAFDHIAHTLRAGTYQFSPVSQIHVRKPGKEGSARAIVVVSSRDQIVVEAVRAELERMYDQVFSARSCHVALKLIKNTWKGTTWFLHYKAPIAFGRLHHETLLRIVSATVQDEEFLCLLGQMFKTSVISLGDRGSRLSALFCDIYYHQLDMEVARMQVELNTGSNKRKVRPCRGYENEGNSETLKPYARVRYVRYADEFLFGITGSKAMALDVLDRVQAFLRRELKLHGP